MIVQTTIGEVEDDVLDKHESVYEDDEKRIAAVEYCVRGCPGVAHVYQQPAGDGCFCPFHVHRSVAVTVKKFPEGGLEGVAANFGS